MRKKPANKRQPRAGWGFPEGERRAHFFVGAASLCGDLGDFRGPLDRSMAPTRDDCPRCRKLVDAVTRLARAA